MTLSNLCRDQQNLAIQRNDLAGIRLWRQYAEEAEVIEECLKDTLKQTSEVSSEASKPSSSG